MSGPASGLGNRYDQVGRNAMFHTFGLGASCVFPERMQGALHAELINTGTVITYENYFMEDEHHEWWKGGIVINAVLKNPLEGALRATRVATGGLDLLHRMEDYGRGLELRMTGDDLPMPTNRVDLDPTYVDEYGLPVARITRSFGPNEVKFSALAQARLLEVLRHPDLIAASSSPSLTFATDHQIGTCRMGEDPTRSVTDRYCRLHDVPNVFVVDTSFMPTGLGVNPMVSTMANALRVGTWIIEQSRRGDDLSRPLAG
jgi:choline dehydrogenase-like flavoprotein